MLAVSSSWPSPSPARACWPSSSLLGHHGDAGGDRPDPDPEADPHAIGYDGDFEGSFEYASRAGGNTFTDLWTSVSNDIAPGAVLIGAVSLAFLFWWDHAKPKQGPLRLLPGPLVVVVIGVVGNMILGAMRPRLAAGGAHLVRCRSRAARRSS